MFQCPKNYSCVEKAFFGDWVVMKLIRKMLFLLMLCSFGVVCVGSASANTVRPAAFGMGNDLMEVDLMLTEWFMKQNRQTMEEWESCQREALDAFLVKDRRVFDGIDIKRLSSVLDLLDEQASLLTRLLWKGHWMGLLPREEGENAKISEQAEGQDKILKSLLIFVDGTAGFERQYWGKQVWIKRILGRMAERMEQGPLDRDVDLPPEMLLPEM